MKNSPENCVAPTGERFAIIIPARFASTRFPGKPLQQLKGMTGVSKPLIQRTYEVAIAATDPANVYVATDSDAVRDAALGFGAQVIMTSESCRNGTERCAEAALSLDHDIIVNLQGDSPLTPASFIRSLVSQFYDPMVDMATAVQRCDAKLLAALKEDRRHGRVGGTTVVLDANRDAMYFSKEVIPHTSDTIADGGSLIPVFHHIGLYAYRREFLDFYKSWPEGLAEKHEGLEQLRVLENGHKVRCVDMLDGPKCWELNNPTDVPIIEAMLLDRLIP